MHLKVYKTDRLDAHMIASYFKGMDPKTLSRTGTRG